MPVVSRDVQLLAHVSVLRSWDYRAHCSRTPLPQRRFSGIHPRTGPAHDALRSRD